MNPRLIRINDEIEKMRGKIADYQVRLKDLERQKIEVENADIVAMVRGIDIPPEEFEAFVLAFKQRQNAVPDIPAVYDGTHNDKEDSSIEK